VFAAAPEDYAAIWSATDCFCDDILAKYPGADIADASLVIAAERLDVTDPATLDRTDFSIYRTRTGAIDLLQHCC
jgi:hypothetical protein